MLIYRSEMTVDESVTPEYLIGKTNKFLSIYGSLPADFWNSESNSTTINSSGCSVDYIWMKDNRVIATFVTYPWKDMGMVQEKTVLDSANHKIGVTLNYRKWQKSKTDISVLIIPEILKALRKDQKILTDNGLPVNQNPEMITTKRLALIKDIRERTVQPDLPVIYLTKRQDTGTFSINPMTLAEIVNGEAHVYAEAQCERLASRWNIARNGFINVIYKNRFTFLNAKQKHYSAIGLSRKIVQYNWKTGTRI